MITMFLRQLMCGLCPVCRVYLTTKRDDLDHAWAGSHHVHLVSMWTGLLFCEHDVLKYVMWPGLPIRLLRCIATPAGSQDSGQVLRLNDSISPSKLPGPARPRRYSAFQLALRQRLLPATDPARLPGRSLVPLRRAGVNICVESGDLPAAQGVVSAMRAAGLPPDLRAYNILVGHPLHGPAPVPHQRPTEIWQPEHP